MKRTRRVLMLLENAPYRADGRVKREARSLTTAGYEVCVICPRPADGQLHQMYDGVRVYQYARLRGPSGALGYLVEWAYALTASGALSLLVWARHGFDILHAHNPPDLFFVLGWFYKLFGKRFVFDHHDLAPELYAARSGANRSRLLERLLLAFERLSCRTADAVIATNQSYAEVERTRDGVPPGRITVVRNGPDADKFKPTSAAPLPGFPLSIVYVGVVNVQDGVEHLVHALALLDRRKNAPEWSCTIVGEGDALASVRSLTDQLGLADRVQFTGWVGQAEVMAHLDRADVCVAPEPSNGLNDRSTIIKILEYMAMAKPSVAFDLPEHRFSAGDSALYACPNSEEDFADKLFTLLSDRELRLRLGQIGRERIDTMLSWQHQEGQLLQAYRGLAGESPRVVDAS